MWLFLLTAVNACSTTTTTHTHSSSGLTGVFVSSDFHIADYSVTNEALSTLEISFAITSLGQASDLVSDNGVSDSQWALDIVEGEATMADDGQNTGHGSSVVGDEVFSDAGSNSFVLGSLMLPYFHAVMAQCETSTTITFTLPFGWSVASFDANSIALAFVDCQEGESFTENGECSAILCLGDEYVSNHVCLPCEDGAHSVPGADATGDDTACSFDLCGYNQYVYNHECLDCASGTKAPSGSDAAGEDTVCTPEVFFDPYADFADVQGIQYWYYLDSNGNEMTYNEDAHAYTADQIAVGPSNGALAITAEQDASATIRWIVPKEGAVAISCDITALTNTGASVTLAVNGVLLWSPTEDGVLDIEEQPIGAGDTIDLIVQGSHVDGVTVTYRIMYVFSFEYDYSTTEQGYNGWFYLAGESLDWCYYDSAQWRSPNTNTWPGVDKLDGDPDLRIAPNTNAPITVRWLVPEDGVIRVSGAYADRNTGNYPDGCLGRLEHNGEILWGPQLVNIALEYYYYTIESLDVLAGDHVDFIVEFDDPSRSISSDGNFLSQIITYVY